MVKLLLSTTSDEKGIYTVTMDLSGYRRADMDPHGAAIVYAGSERSKCEIMKGWEQNEKMDYVFPGNIFVGSHSLGSGGRVPVPHLRLGQGGGGPGGGIGSHLRPL